MCCKGFRRILLEIQTILVTAKSVLLPHLIFSVECRCGSWNSSSLLGSGGDFENANQVLKLAEYNSVPQNLVALKKSIIIIVCPCFCGSTIRTKQTGMAQLCSRTSRASAERLESRGGTILRLLHLHTWRLMLADS